MCEFCSDDCVNAESVSAVPPGGEWTCDEEDCWRRAAWCTIFGYVDDHYCDEHRNAQGEPAALELTDATFEYTGDYLLRIRQTERCAGPILGPACGNGATWARVTRAQSFACGKHKTPVSVESQGEVTP